MMNSLRLLALSLTVLFFFTACQSETSQTSAADNSATAANNVQVSPSSTPATQQLRDTFDCDLHGTTDPTTHFWNPELELFYTMATDASSKNTDATAHFNVFQIYNTINCHLISNNIMGYDGTVKRPIRIHTDIYEPINQLVCAQGTGITMCYHTGRKETLPPMQVQYPHHLKNKLVPESAGKDLAIWKKFLFAGVEGIGTMAYDLRERKGTSMPPAAIYNGSKYQERLSLFLVPDGKGYQAIIPIFDGKEMTVQALFSEAMDISSKVIIDSFSGRFMLTRPNGNEKRMIIDMQALKAFAPPKAGMKIPEILDYLAKEFS